MYFKSPMRILAPVLTALVLSTGVLPCHAESVVEPGESYGVAVNLTANTLQLIVLEPARQARTSVESGSTGEANFGFKSSAFSPG